MPSTLRIQTNDDTDASDWWQPGSETFVQATGPDSVAVIVESRLDDGGPPSFVARASIGENPFLRIAHVPWLRVRVRGNSDGDEVIVRSDEI